MSPYESDLWLGLGWLLAPCLLVIAGGLIGHVSHYQRLLAIPRGAARVTWKATTGTGRTFLRGAKMLAWVASMPIRLLWRLVKWLYRRFAMVGESALQLVEFGVFGISRGELDISTRIGELRKQLDEYIAVNDRNYEIGNKWIEGHRKLEAENKELIAKLLAAREVALEEHEARSELQKRLNIANGKVAELQDEVHDRRARAQELIDANKVLRNDLAFGRDVEVALRTELSAARSPAHVQSTGGGGGRIVVPYADAEELERLLMRLHAPPGHRVLP